MRFFGCKLAPTAQVSIVEFLRKVVDNVHYSTIDVYWVLKQRIKIARKHAILSHFSHSTPFAFYFTDVQSTDKLHHE